MTDRTIKRRSIILAGRKTSVTLEEPFYLAIRTLRPTKICNYPTCTTGFPPAGISICHRQSGYSWWITPLGPLLAFARQIGTTQRPGMKASKATVKENSAGL
jgi:hypothetical protein